MNQVAQLLDASIDRFDGGIERRQSKATYGMMWRCAFEKTNSPTGTPGSKARNCV